MNINCKAKPCPILLDSTCVYYSGGKLIYIGAETNDNLKVILKKIDDKLGELSVPLTSTEIIQALGYVPLQDAPSDGVVYGRRNNVWFPVSLVPGGGTVTNVSVTPGTGISASVTNPSTTPNITITNTSPDQIVTLTPGTGISITGTYPNFTISTTGGSGGGVWGSITGTLSTQTDLQNALNAKFNIPSGNTSQYVRGDGSLAAFPSIPAAQVNSDWNAVSGVAQILNKPTIPTVTPSALTKTDDTNVTLTLSGTPGTALLQSVGLQLGWTGTLADSRIASAAIWNAKGDLSSTGSYSNPTWLTSLDWSKITGAPSFITSAITSLNGLTSTSQSFVNDTNITITSVGSTHTLGWSGTLSDSRITSASTWNAKQDAISLTTTGTSGPATFIANTLNIPQYTDQFTGTVTSVTAGTGTSFTTITNSGAINIDTTKVPYYAAGFTPGFAKWNGSSWIFDNNTYLTSITSSDVTTALGYTPVTNARNITINGTTQDLTTDRTWNVGTVTSVGLTMPAAFGVASTPVTGAGTLAVTALGNASQYIRGDGVLANLPTTPVSGGASVNYYLNGSVSQGTIGGNTYYELSKTPILGLGTDFTRTNAQGNGIVARFITDVNDPSLLAIPAGNFIFLNYFSSSSAGGSPQFYISLSKYDGTTFTLIADNSANPENIDGGTSIDLYYTALAVPLTALAITDRLVVDVYVITGGRDLTLHTEGPHLSEVQTTFSTGLTALNGSTDSVQFFTQATSGTDFNISTSGNTHTFNLPVASAINTGKLSNTDWTTFNSKQAALSGTGIVKSTAGVISYLTDNSANWDTAYANRITSLTTVGSSGAATLISNVLNIPNYTLSGLGGQPQLNGTGFVKATGTTITYDNSTYVPTSRTINTTGPLTGGGDLSADRTISIPQANAVADGYLSNTDWSTFNSKQDAITLTTIGSSGSASLTGATLNIPTYSLSGLGGVATSRNITINGTTQDLSADRTWNVGDLLSSASYSNPTWLTSLAWSKITGTPTTLAGYGITDSVVLTTGSYADPSWITSLDWSKITNVPALGGISSLNTLTATTQTFAIGTSGTNFNISSVGSVHTFNLPNASATNRGALTAADWTTFNSKEPAITAGTTLQYYRGDKTFQTLNTAAVPESTNLYYTDARARNSISLTTTGSSGVATYNNTTGVLNVPQYGGAGGSGFGYTLVMGFNVTALAANETYVIGTLYGSGAITLFENRPSRWVLCPKVGNIVSASVVVQLNAATYGSPSSSQMQIRVHNITQSTNSVIDAAYQITSGLFSGGSTPARNTFYNITPLAVNQGDQIQVRIVTPSWTTAPATMSINIILFIE